VHFKRDFFSGLCKGRDVLDKNAAEYIKIPTITVMKYTFILVLYLYIRGLQQASEETYFKEAILCPFTKS